MARGSNGAPFALLAIDFVKEKSCKSILKKKGCQIFPDSPWPCVWE